MAGLETMSRVQTTPSRRRARGFLVIEALVALLVLTTGLLGLTTLYSHVTSAAAEAKSRSEAMAQAQSLLDTLRNNVLESQYNANLADGSYSDTLAAGTYSTSYTRNWRISQAGTGLDNKLVEVEVSWTDRAGNTQRVQLNAILGWNDPARGLMTQYRLQQLVPKPKGDAERKQGTYRPGDAVTLTPPTAGQSTVLQRADNNAPLLELKPKADGSAQNFITINGRVYIDQSATRMPASTDIYVRLSSEGLCVFDNRSSAMTNYPATGSPVYRYFSYTCYVGPGWYGNVGVEIQETSSLPTICVGDPSFTNATFSATPASTEASFRSYRGFRALTTTTNGVSSTVYINTGAASSTTVYTYGDDGSPSTAIPTRTAKAGMPRPSDYSGTYQIGQDSTDNYFRQDFLITRVTGNSSCQQKMLVAPAAFQYNAGRNFCISPDNSTEPDQCPTVWPGQTVGTCPVTVSGSFNPTVSNPTISMSCTTSTGASCACSVLAGVAGYSCTTTGGNSPTMTITALATTRGNNRQTESCVRTTGPLACGPTTGFNIETSTSSCTIN